MCLPDYETNTVLLPMFKNHCSLREKKDTMFGNPVAQTPYTGFHTLKQQIIFKISTKISKKPLFTRQMTSKFFNFGLIFNL